MFRYDISIVLDWNAWVMGINYFQSILCDFQLHRKLVAVINKPRIAARYFRNIKKKKILTTEIKSPLLKARMP